MTDQFRLIVTVALSMVAAMVVSFLLTPVVKSFAFRIGAIDVPKDARRMHKVPIPRLGGLAIFLGFLLSVLLFVKMTPALRSILLGAVIIVLLGVMDDVHPLPALLKFFVQIGAALVAVYGGTVVRVVSNPNVFSTDPWLELGVMAVPITVLWIVGITNSVNLIDGLDGLAVGVSTISSLAMLAIAIVVSEGEVALVMAALAGACIGFMPYNVNPAKIFMGDTGATFLGFILATISIQGLFKFYAVISFAIPFLVLGLPLFDTVFACVRRLAHGQSPMHADRGHVHHRLIDMGLTQKQAVATLYVVSAILGLAAVVLTTSGEIKAMILLTALCAAAWIAWTVFTHNHNGNGKKNGGGEAAGPQAETPAADEPAASEAGETPPDTPPEAERAVPAQEESAPDVPAAPEPEEPETASASGEEARNG